ncbi:hypothetical protein [uncultured Sphingomonas sp.]|uniref:hypothetical protein n=1 Tax=uncultured Sphingomonas sp. TaxID=158754 RepID=UPI0025E7EE0E|nr:hypothetical protein [uncultured Sphingomonas sp.]
MNYALLTAPFLLAACAKPPDPVNCAVPPDGFHPWRDAPYSLDAYARNVISVSNEAISWNGTIIEDAPDKPAFSVLEQFLGINAQLQPPFSTAITFEKGVACSRVTAVRDLIDKHLSCRENFGTCLQGEPPWERD